MIQLRNYHIQDINIFLFSIQSIYERKNLINFNEILMKNLYCSTKKIWFWICLIFLDPGDMKIQNSKYPMKDISIISFLAQAYKILLLIPYKCICRTKIRSTFSLLWNDQHYEYSSFIYFCSFKIEWILLFIKLKQYWNQFLIGNR